MPKPILVSSSVVWTLKILVLEEPLRCSIWLSPITEKTDSEKLMICPMSQGWTSQVLWFLVRFPLPLECLSLDWRGLSKGLFNPIISHHSLGADYGKCNQILLQNKNSPLGCVSVTQTLWIISATTRQGVGNLPLNAHIPDFPSLRSPNSHST